MTVKRAAVYLRVASDDACGVKLAGQEESIRRWAEQHGFIVTEIYRDAGSGNSEERPGLQQMMQDARAGRFEVLIVRDPTRLFRIMSVLREYCTQLQECRVPIVIAGDGCAE